MRGTTDLNITVSSLDHRKHAHTEKSNFHTGLVLAMAYQLFLHVMFSS